MYARLKSNCGIEEAKKDIKQLTEKVEKLGKVGEKLGEGRTIEFGAHLMAMEQADKPVSGFLLGK